MGKYQNEASILLHAIGGKDNIQSVMHCVTRMRFVLIDDSLADIKAIEDMSITKGIMNQSGQFQVIIGNDVTQFYNDFIEVSGISKTSNSNTTSTQQTPIQKFMSTIGEIFAPLIPVIICGGFILGIKNCLDTITFCGYTLIEIYPFLVGMDTLLEIIYQAIFQLLPIGIIWSVTKKMGTNQILGIVLGIILVYPALSNTTDLNFYPYNMELMNYQSHIMPALLAGFMLVYLDKLFTKITPNVIQIIIVPLFSLLLSTILTYTLLGPIGITIDNAISSIIWYCLTCPFNFIFGLLFGGLYFLIVLRGFHHLTLIIDLQLITAYDGTLLWPMIALANIAQGSATLAITYLQRKDEKLRKENIDACISCYLGVSEPALFGVNLKYKFPFICGMIGSAIASVISIKTGIIAASIGIGGIPGILSILPKYFGHFFISMIVAIIAPFILTYILGYKQFHELSFVAPMKGKMIPLSDVDDQVFSQKLMGDGFAIELDGNKVIAPFDGEVIMTFPTKHAYGLRRSDGLEVLIHIGMDTVQLNGEGFKCLVKTGDLIKKGQVICEIDSDYIKRKGKSLVSPIVITSRHQFRLLEDKENILEVI
ncbi:MAG: PTS trehalose transporter subunit IIBC [Erysipelotrichaceae bacterium]|nr:PTS trehalose transporter subunit IIBC [Erysipelotrichaceae bacterium]